MPDFSQEIYIDPRTDFGFKHLFGKESNKEFLISFINSLLRGKHVVRDLQYLPTENLGLTHEARNSIFDVYCVGVGGEHFIVEMQNAYQPSFKSRSVYYSTFAIQAGVVKGARNYKFPPVYTICLLNFSFDQDPLTREKYLTEVKLMDVDSKSIFFDDVTFLYVELPKFLKNATELESDLDKWVFLIRNLVMLSHRPEALQTRMFERFFEQARIKKLSPQEARRYQTEAMSLISFHEMLDYRQQKGIKEGRKEGIEKGREEGLKEGMKEGIKKAKLDMARSMAQSGMPLEKISSITGLSISEISELAE